MPDEERSPEEDFKRVIKEKDAEIDLLQIRLKVAVGGKLKTLTVKDGDFILFLSDQPVLLAPDAEILAQRLMADGKKGVVILNLPRDVKVQHLPEKAMGEFGWVRKGRPKKKGGK